MYKLLMSTAGSWEWRYAEYADDGEGRYGDGRFDFVNANAFNAHHLVAYPPESGRGHELRRAFQLLIITLELDPWNHRPSSLPEVPWHTDHTWWFSSLNVS
jgi:hypothetical protein